MRKYQRVGKEVALNEDGTTVQTDGCPRHDQALRAVQRMTAVEMDEQALVAFGQSGDGGPGPSGQRVEQWMATFQRETMFEPET